MIPLWRPMVAGGLAILLASPVDRLVPVVPRGNAARWPVLALTTLLACYLLFAAPVLAFASAGCLAYKALHRDPTHVDGPRARPFHVVLVVIAAFLLVMLVDRPATPCFWDAFVWLAKARVAAHGPAALIAGGLTRGAYAFIPQGYPLFEPLAVGVLAGLSADPRAVVAGAVGLETLALLLFLSSIVDDDRVTAKVTVRKLVMIAVVLLSCPLVVVHLRSAYVDLPLGLLVAALAMLLPRRGTGIACAALAMAAASMKDEGLAHVAVIAALGIARAGTKRDPETRMLRQRALACGSAALAVAAMWHLRLHHVELPNADHALSLPDWSRLRPLLVLTVEHVTDLESWGALWVLGAGAILAAVVRPRAVAGSTWWLGSVLVGEGLVVLLALMATPERVMTFASEGSLLNRLAIQLAPCAALLVASWVEPVAAVVELSGPDLHENVTTSGA
jgi:hypothetical protein